MDHLSPEYPVFYPKRIRRIVPWYEEMVQTVVSAATHISETRNCNCRTIVELGLGDGYLVRKLLEASPQTRVLALEISPHVCQTVKQGLGGYCDSGRLQIFNHNINQMDELKAQLKCCRVVICSLLLHDINPEKQLDFLKLCGEMLSPTGSMVLADPMLTGSDFMDEILVKDWVAAMLANGFPQAEIDDLRRNDPCMFQALKEEDLVGLFYKAGFATVRTIWRRCNFTVAIASKK